MSSSQQSEPPQTSSHTPKPPSQTIKLPPLAFVGVALLLFGVSFPALSWPAGLGWLLVIPVLAAVWVVRVRTTVDYDGLTMRRVIGSDTVAWEQVRGIHFPDRRWARVVLEDKTEKSLPLVRFDRLPLLAAASGGRITDPYAAAAAAESAEENADENASQDTDSRESN